MNCRNIILALLLFCTPAGAVTLPPAGYVQTFSDTFTELSISNSSTHDGSRWYTTTMACCMSPSNSDHGYLYPGYATVAEGINSPFSLINGGGLNIAMSKQTGTNAPYSGWGPSWVGGIIASQAPDGKGFAQQFGYFEMKAKMPTSAPGAWTAFWMVPAAGYASDFAPWGNLHNDGEIDIMEGYGQFLTGTGSAYTITLHDWLHGATPGQNNANVGDMAGDYHTYGLLWTEAQITLFFDGTQVGQYPTPAVMKQPYYILVDLGMGGGWPTETMPDPTQMQVAYVKAWKAGTAPPPVQPPPPQVNNTIYQMTPTIVTARAGSTSVPVKLHLGAVPTAGSYQVCVRVIDNANRWLTNYNDCFWPPTPSASASGDEQWDVNISLPANQGAGVYKVTAAYAYWNGATYAFAPLTPGPGVTPSPELANYWTIGTMALY